MSTRKRTSPKPANYKWMLALIMVIVLAFGWRFPLLGFIVPVAMLTGIIGGFFRGRWVCGNLCPRGSFLDSWFSLVAAKKQIPALFRKKSFRWSLLVALMGFMAFRLSQNIGSVNHWGLVFWQMCLITTIAGVFLGLRYSARSWCSICPVGTMAGTIGGKKYRLQVDASCKACGLCESSCPMQLNIASYRGQESQKEMDCIKCGVCHDICPQNVLSWPEKKAA